MQYIKEGAAEFLARDAAEILMTNGPMSFKDLEAKMSKYYAKYMNEAERGVLCNEFFNVLFLHIRNKKFPRLVVNVKESKDKYIFSTEGLV